MYFIGLLLFDSYFINYLINTYCKVKPARVTYDIIPITGHTLMQLASLTDGVHFILKHVHLCTEAMRQIPLAKYGTRVAFVISM